MFRFIFLFMTLLSVFNLGQVLANEEQGPPGGISLTTATETKPEDALQEEITIVNQSTYQIKKVRCIAIGSGNRKVDTEFGPVEAGQQKTSQFTAWHQGTFAVELDYEVEGQIVKSRPFTSVLDQPLPLPKVELTFGNSRKSSGGVWKNIVWKSREGSQAGSQ